VEIGDLAALERPEIKDILFDSTSFMRQEQEDMPELRHTDLYTMTVYAQDGTPLNCRVYEGRADKPHIIYYPAEYETEETLSMLAEGMGEYGFNLISLDYRGIGQSGGKASFTAMPSDAETFFLGVKKWMKQDGRQGKLCVMGRSLGCAPALMMAEKFEDDLLCLILESAFDRTEDFLKGVGVPVEVVDKCMEQCADPFSNRKRMQKITKPVMFIHSPRDQVQTLAQVEWLVAESRSKATQFQVAPSGTREDLAHVAGHLYCAALRQYINLRMGIRPARKPRHKRKAVKQVLQ